MSSGTGKGHKRTESDLEPKTSARQDIEVIGSLIYEEPASGDLSLSFYSSKFSNEKKESRYP